MAIKSILVVFIISTILISCHQKEKVEEGLDNYSKMAFISSHKIAKNAIKDIMANIESKKHNPETRDTAYIYKPKADSIVNLCDKLTDYLEKLVDRVNNNEKLEDKDSLFEKLRTFEATLVKIDTRNEVFGNSILDIDTLIGFKNMNRNEFNNQLLKVASKNQTLAFINSIEQDVLNAEVKLIDKINKDCGYRDLIFDKYYALITQNSEQLKPNNILEITAGIGRFEYHPNAKFTIGNKEIPINDSTNGVAIYKMKVSDKKGRHTIRTKISWKKPNGEPIELEKEIVYYVE